MKYAGCYQVTYQYRSDGDNGRWGTVYYNVKDPATAMRRFFAEYGGKKDNSGNVITPVFVKEV